MPVKWTAWRPDRPLREEGQTEVCGRAEERSPRAGVWQCPQSRASSVSRSGLRSGGEMAHSRRGKDEDNRQESVPSWKGLTKEFNAVTT